MLPAPSATFALTRIELLPIEALILKNAKQGSIGRERRKMDLEIKGSSELEKEVLQRDLCTLCGACVGMCPYLVAFKGRVVLLDI